MRSQDNETILLSRLASLVRAGEHLQQHQAIQGLQEMQQGSHTPGRM
jgi:hypothetical protein